MLDNAPPWLKEFSTQGSAPYCNRFVMTQVEPTIVRLTFGEGLDETVCPVIHAQITVSTVVAHQLMQMLAGLFAQQQGVAEVPAHKVN